jgi:excisionase family DNA binding protein
MVELPTPFPRLTDRGGWEEVYLAEEDNPFDRYVSAREAARLKGVHINSVYKAAASGKINHVRFGERWLIERASLEGWTKVGRKPKGYKHT